MVRCCNLLYNCRVAQVKTVQAEDPENIAVSKRGRQQQRTWACNDQHCRYAIDDFSGIVVMPIDCREQCKAKQYDGKILTEYVNDAALIVIIRFVLFKGIMIP